MGNAKNKRVKLGQLVTIKSGYSPSSFTLSEAGPLPYIKVDDMNNCDKYQERARFYTNDTRRSVPAGAVIFPKRGAAITNNKVRITKLPVCMDTNMMALIPNSELLDSEYLFNVLIYEKLFKIADTSSIPQINNKHIVPYVIPLPSIGEQRAIADILQTWDTAIEKTEALIAAKEKQFDWLKYTFFLRNPKATHRQPKPFGEYIEEKQRRSTISNMYLCLTSSRHGMFLQGEYFSKQVASKDNTGYKIMERGDFTFRSMSDDGIFVFNQQTIVDKGLISPAYSVFAPKSNVNEDYLYYFLNSPTFRRTLIKEAQGGTRTALKLNALKKLNIDIPELGEQKSIANKLNLAKREIDTLKSLADLYRTQKRGLMQKLLTGKWRVKV